MATQKRLRGVLANGCKGKVRKASKNRSPSLSEVKFFKCAHDGIRPSTGGVCPFIGNFNLLRHFVQCRLQHLAKFERRCRGPSNKEC